MYILGGRYVRRTWFEPGILFLRIYARTRSNLKVEKMLGRPFPWHLKGLGTFVHIRQGVKTYRDILEIN